jgi:hypothetical protein
MGRLLESLDDELVRFIGEQSVFFVASATAESRINLSPKGLDTFRVLGPNRVAYLDLTGSGNETAAHVLHDGRLTVMFCAFSGKPMILRLWGKARVVRSRDAEWAGMVALFPELPGTRQVIVLDVVGVQTSCGFGVPEMAVERERTMLPEWAEKKGREGIAQYWQKKNVETVDGLPTGLLE